MAQIDIREPFMVLPTQKDWMDQLHSIEPYMYWEAFEAKIVRDKMIHVVTDGGARSNPGNAGWGAIVRQNKRRTSFFGDYEHAKNNAMGLRAVIRASRTLPKRMHIWISTDLAYFKKEITECMDTWLKRNWKTGNGTPVANKSLWQTLIDVLKRHARVIDFCPPG
jgi:ribonuclease HI